MMAQKAKYKMSNERQRSCRAVQQQKNMETIKNEYSKPLQR